MSDEIQPALALREWYEVKQSDREPIHDAAGALMQSLMPNVDEPGLGRTTSERLVACMAIANAALPNGDPRKITTSDIAGLEASDKNEYAPELERLAKKLRALLPPNK